MHYVYCPTKDKTVFLGFPLERKDDLCNVGYIRKRFKCYDQDYKCTIENCSYLREASKGSR